MLACRGMNQHNEIVLQVANISSLATVVVVNC